jgi:uncharacterized damage-inducible protein DinB
MELNNIRQLYDYNRWADRRILTVASTLVSDDFIRPMGNSHLPRTLKEAGGTLWMQNSGVMFGC